MEWLRNIVVSLAILSFLSVAVRSEPTFGGRKMKTNDDSYCESWKFSVENNDAGVWKTVPKRCVSFVKSYVSGYRYLSDAEFVVSDALAFAKTVDVSKDGKDCWVFDIDESLLSNLPYYAKHGYGSQTYNATSFDEWTEMGIAPALPASLGFYKELQKLNFTIVLLTGRSETYRNITVKNLHSAGFTSWKKLLLRESTDEGTTALSFKSGKRVKLVAEGYRIHGSSGDQWSDLLGNATAVRSFKIPNPMYYIS